MPKRRREQGNDSDMKKIRSEPDEENELRALKNGNFTLWDLNRPVRKPITDEKAQVKVKTIALSHDLKCPICMEFLSNTYTVMECMHRFCSGCIQSYLRRGKQECPSCRQKVPSRRSLRHDTRFDELIRCIYPEVDAHEQHEAKLISKLKVDVGRSNAAKIQRDLALQLAHRKRQRYKGRQRKTTRRQSKDDDSSDSSDSSSDDSSDDGGSSANSSGARASKKSRKSGQTVPKQPAKATAPQRKTPQQRGSASAGKQKAAQKRPSRALDTKCDACFMLQVHPKEKRLEQLQHRWLRTSSQIRVVQLKKYLQLKLNHKPYTDFVIEVHRSTGNRKMERLKDDMPYSSICKKLGVSKENGSYLKFMYRLVAAN